MQRFAHFGSTDRHNVPEGGFCISVFAILKKGRKVLLLKPRQHPRWTEEWAPNWRIYEPAVVAAEMKEWRFPSTYVKEGEAPDSALVRLMTEQLGIKRYRVQANKFMNFYEPSSRHPGKMHWDYCFIYDISTRESPSSSPWISDVDFVDPRTLSKEQFGSSQGDLAKALGLV